MQSFLQAIRSPGSNRTFVEIEALIRAIPDFPIPGILFRDITPLLKDKQGFRRAIDLFVERFKGRGIEHVIGIESRGYIFAAPIAYAIGAGFIPVRKPGKLPHEKLSEEYALEYGTNSLEIHADALRRGERVSWSTTFSRPAEPPPRRAAFSSALARRSKPLPSWSS